MVDNVQGVNPLGNAGNSRRIKKAYMGSAQAPRGADGITKSAELQKLSKIEGIRLEKVLEIRKQIQAGTYLEEEKLSTSIDQAIDEAYGS